jgi:hypothetical protein
MTDLTAWLLEQIDADEQTARDAIDAERPGTHWQWVDGATDAVLDGDAVTYAVDEGLQVSLRTVEQFPTPAVGPLPAFPLGYVEDGGDAARRHLRPRPRPGRV